MFQNIQFRDCVHRDVVGPTTDAVMVAVLGEHCAPGTAPVEAGSLFYGVTQVLGETEFRKVWAEFQKNNIGRKANPLSFADFLTAHEHGRALPALPDLARFDLAYTLAAQPGPMPSVAACCLPDATIRAHPGMMLRFQPNWRYLGLASPVHRLLADALTPDLIRTFSDAEPCRIRLSPTGMGVSVIELAPADFALQSALRSGQCLGAAIAAAQAIDPSFDPYSVVAGLVESGAIMDVVLHPAETPSLKQPTP